MNSKLLKLEPPYNIIYAGGQIGRHIATLLTWEDPEPEELQIPYAASYAVIDQGNKMPAGTLVNDVQLEECRIVCNEDDLRINLCDFAALVKYDFEQPSPIEAGHMWEKLTNLDVEMVFDKIKGTDEEKSDYEVTLYFFGAGGYYKVDSNLANGFCFQVMPTRCIISCAISMIYTWRCSGSTISGSALSPTTVSMWSME